MFEFIDIVGGMLYNCPPAVGVQHGRIQSSAARSDLRHARVEQEWISIPAIGSRSAVADRSRANVRANRRFEGSID